MAKPTPKQESATRKQSASREASEPETGKQPANQPASEPPANLNAPEPLPQRNVTAINDRVSLKIVGGKFDTDSMRDSTAATFKSVFSASMSDPEFRKWAGIESQLAPEAVEELFKPEQFGMLLDILVMFESIGLSAKTALSYEECKKHLAWSEAEHNILDKQGARIICRYVPVEWLKRADLIIFIVMFLSLTAMKMKKVTEEAKEKLERIGKVGERPVSIAPAPTAAPAQPEQAA